jgi:tetratricopeptide (TPR) repeat protein
MNARNWLFSLSLLFLVGCGGASPGATIPSTERQLDESGDAIEAKPKSSPDDQTGGDKASSSVTEPEPFQGNPAAALPTGRQVPESAQGALAAGRDAAANGDLATAQARFSEVASQGVAEGHYNLGIIAEWQGRKQTARTSYEKALAAEAEFAPAAVAICRLLLRANDPNGAIRFAEDLQRSRPDSLDLQNALDQVRLLAQTDPKVVAESAKKVLRKDEKNVAAMVNLARAYQLEGKHELAVAILENAAALSPDDPEVPFLQALSFDGMNEPRRARAALEAAVARPGGGSAEAYNNLGLIYHDAGDFTGAEAQFRKAIARWPEMVDAYANLGNALKGQQRYADADAALKQALSLGNDDPDVLFDLGILYLDGNLPNVESMARLEQAVGYFDRYKSLRKQSPPDDPVDRYIAEARKRIEVEQKRADQLRNASKPAPAPVAPAAEGEAAQ